MEFASDAPTAVEILLRLVGAFYAATAPLVLKAAAFSHFLTRALSALGAAKREESRAETLRTAILAGNAVLIGCAGIWLLVLSAAAAPLFVLASLFYALYLVWFAPRFLDPYDPPEEPGRSQTRNALLVYLGATALVAGGWHADLLVPPRDMSAASFWSAAALSAALVAYAAYVFKPSRSHPDEAEAVEEDDWQTEPEEPVKPSERAILRPGWTHGFLVDAETGLPTSAVAGVDLTEVDLERLRAWQERFRELADPDDPLRQALRNPASQVEIEAMGQAILETLRERAGDRISLDPLALPNDPTVSPVALKVMADHHCAALWHDGGDQVGNIIPDEIGISWSLARDLDSWAWDFETCIDWNDPDGPPLWNTERFAEHDREGAELAGRLAEELRRTGRPDVAVRHVPHAAPERDG